MSPIQPPGWTEDNIYASYLDRLLVKSLGVQAGVVEENDYKVTAGAGLQVKIEKGKAFVAQTGAIEESSNTFFNGLYNVLSSTESTPYNNVEVSAVNPQIAQIILRVYDVGELKISGQSYARLEWLNGSPNAGATKLHILQGKASEFEAAALPQSSLRLCYVVVPKNATKSSEYEILDERGLSKETELNLVINSSSSEILARSGQYIETTATNAAIALPAPMKNAVVEIFCRGTTTTIGSTLYGGSIYGDFINGFSNIKLTANQHARFRGDATNWLISSGEPKREQTYGAFIVRTNNTEYEASPVRPTFVTMKVGGEETVVDANIYVGGVLMGGISAPAATVSTLGFIVPAGVKWKWEILSGTVTVNESSYLLL